MSAESGQLQADIGVIKKGKEKIKQKLKEVMRRSEEEKTTLQQELQKTKTEKAETCNALRTEFGEALESRDTLTNNLKEKLDTLKNEKQESDEHYEKLCRELRASLKEESSKNEKLEEEAIQLKTHLENVDSELAKVRSEKDSIGNTIRVEFDHICSGLRTDLEKALREKDEIHRALEVGRLGLEKELVEKEETFDGLMQIVKEKDEILNEDQSENLKAELGLLKREVSDVNVKLEQEQRVVEEKNAVIQTLEDDRKRLLSERDEALAKIQQEVAEISSIKDSVIENLENRLSETADEHVQLSEKYEEISQEFQEIVEKIASCVKENDEDSSFQELLAEECLTVKDERKRSNTVVNKIVGDWVDTRRRFEKESRQWQTEEESYKLTIEKLTNEKEESCDHIRKEWQANIEEKDEIIEGLTSQVNQSHLEIERRKEENSRKMKELEEILENEQSSHAFEKEQMVEKLKNAAMQIRESGEELVKLGEQIKKNEEEIKELNEEKTSLDKMMKEFEFVVEEKKEEVENLNRDLAVVQNERSHLETSFHENIEHTNDDFNELFAILRKDNPDETDGVLHDRKKEVRGMVSKLVREVEKGRDDQEKLKEEKTRICQDIRKEFESTLFEKERILEELREEFKNNHKENDELMTANKEKDRRMKKVEKEMAEFRNQLNQDRIPEAGLVESTINEEGRSEQDHAQQHEAVTTSVVENVMAETLEESTALPSLVENESVLRNTSQLTNENVRLKEELETLEDLYNERNSQTSLLVEDVIKLREENGSLKEVLEVSKSEHSQFFEIEEKNESMRQSLENLELENKSLKDELELSRVQDEDSSMNEKTESMKGEFMEIIRDKELVTQRLEQDLMSYSRDISVLREELARASKERAAYERLRRDFDHIVSGLRGDMERALSDREEKSRMLDDLRSQLNDNRLKDTSEEKSDGAPKTSSETVEKELVAVKTRLREVMLVNRQLKELGKSLNAELKETRKDKQQSERQCQDLRNEMEAFVKEKEAIIVECRERVETSEKIHSEKMNELRKVCDGYFIIVMIIIIVIVHYH